MDHTLLTPINQEVYRRFPELRGVKPSMQKLAQNTLLIYQSLVSLPGNKTLQRSVRVVVNEQGKIVKISTSRG
ncbi:MAG: hypothetical protein MUE67_07245 [Anaerolineales bacterium]|jgi:hypothetical protein|nr:hypothetical protein [Anaerolineales bacterium]